MRVAVAGASGLIGGALTRHLRQEGHQVDASGPQVRQVR